MTKNYKLFIILCFYCTSCIRVIPGTNFNNGNSNDNENAEDDTSDESSYVFKEKDDYVFDLKKYSVIKGEELFDYYYDSDLSFFEETALYADNKNTFIIVNNASNLTEWYVENSSSNAVNYLFVNDNNYKYYDSIYLDPKLFIVPLNDNHKSYFSLAYGLGVGYRQTNGTFPITWISLFVSNNIYGLHIGVEDEDQALIILQLIYNTNYFPYDVYVIDMAADIGASNAMGNAYSLFLIPQEENFSKHCLKTFSENGNVHYFDFEAIRNYNE